MTNDRSQIETRFQVVLIGPDAANHHQASWPTGRHALPDSIDYRILRSRNPNLLFVICHLSFHSSFRREWGN